jgi:sugar lactone lactonase YvrE
MKRFIGHSLIVLMLWMVACLVPAIAAAAGFQYAGSFGSKGSGSGQFDGIGGIAIDAAGNVYVADVGNHRIEKFTTSGSFVTSWPSVAVEGIAVDRAGNVYAADYWNAQILKFSAGGTTLGQFNTTLPGEFQSQPVSIAVDSSGAMWITDAGSLSVKKFDAAGNYVSTLGTTGDGPGQFAWPSGIDIDASDTIYVVDLRRYDIQKFSAAGAFIIGGLTIHSGDANMLRPINVTVDGGGNAYVSDSFSGTLGSDASVKQFNPDLIFQTRIGAYSGSGMPAGTFASVGGLAIDPAGTLYVADGSYDRVLKYTGAAPPGGTPTVGVKVSARSVHVGQSVTIRGTVKGAGATKTVSICRKSHGKLKLLKRVALNAAGAYRWSRKMTTTGKWVLVVTYRVGGTTYTSKAVTVTVHK